ncbi:D-alanyl-D-alanine carboxypeptidase/D-alanyl-D-alanine-endopeptidase [Micromonospora sp. NPDC049523]|uniref:D-alanyl-D-alanine carboxypeptidase/D-alanyl-D-alanine endopeptidase n=1 Tax=Micromonospora sp. NPDC049523 TaxID=3155921 RepID=UPI003412AAFF
MRSPEDGASGRAGIPPTPPAPPAAGPPDPVTPPPARPARRRTGLLVGLTAVVALALAGAGVVVVKPGPVAGWMGQTEPAPTIAADPPEPPPGAVLAAAGTSAPVPTPDGLRTVLDPLVGADVLGPSVHVAVVDVASRELLYGQGPQTLTVPASTTKLITAATVLSARGPAYRIATRAVAGAAPGEVVLVGGGDPTLAINATGIYPGAGRLDQLAAQVKQALGGVAPTKVTVDSSLFPKPVYGPGWDADIPTGGFAGPITALMTDGGRVDPKDNVKGAERYANPDIAAGRALARALGLPTAAVNAVARGSAPPDAAAPPAGSEASPGTDQASPATGQATPGTELGRVESPPMGRLVEFMLADSDNVVAEALARQVALARNQPASFDGAAAAMDAVVGELKLPADQSTLSDGSGLSRNNRISPELLTDVLALAADGSRPELAGIFAGLPVAGWSGTLTERFGGQAASAAIGVVRAKTGTLTGVHAIAGVVTTAQGRLLAFSVLADQVPVDSEQAQPPLDRIAAALASCGCGS